jgi:FtsZ-interacting cell division protein ZipA
MSTLATILIVVLAAVAVAALLLFGIVTFRARRRERLEREFGAEYQRAVARAGSEAAAEDDLAERRKQRSRLDIRELDPARRDHYLQRWRAIESQFVARPVDAVAEADQLVTEIMSERGYPVDDFERRAADISVDYPEIVEGYRAAHSIARATQEGTATTEDHRQAVVHYRSLCEQLLGADVRPGAGWSPGGSPNGSLNQRSQ